MHGFDTWQGLTEFVAEDEGAVEKRGAYKGSLDELKQMVDLSRLQDDIVLHMGAIEETRPRLMEENKALTFSFAYCDTDLYASTKVIVENVHPHLAKGGIMVFDEWNRSDYPGEGRAVNEFLAAYGHCYDVLHVKGAPAQSGIAQDRLLDVQSRHLMVPSLMQHGDHKRRGRRSSPGSAGIMPAP